MQKNKCRRCRAKGPTFKHHPLPVRTFGTTESGNDWVVRLCSDCHKGADKITLIIEEYISRGEEWVYRKAFANFMRQRPT